MSKRLKSSNNMTEGHAVNTRIAPIENNPSQSSLSYHQSICGALLLPLPSNSPMEIFDHLRHGQFDRFQRCLESYHREIIRMKNPFEQTVLHVITIHAYPFQWTRLLLMRGCDPCAQDQDGYTSVHYAIERDDVEMLKALTTRFAAEIKLFSNEQIDTIHRDCLKAISIRQKQGLTGFMLACYQQSIKCLNYLLELQINDVDLQDIYGDTCLHYAIARRNQTLVEILINQCHANVNGGDQTRPSALDILQFNRDQQKSFEKDLDDSIEHLLLSHHALNRSHIRRRTNKLDSQIRTARNYARLASSSEKNGDVTHSQEYYHQAIKTVPNNTLDWTEYAFKIAMTHITRGENQSALDLLQKALIIRNRLENQTDEINQIQRAINDISSSGKCAE